MPGEHRKRMTGNERKEKTHSRFDRVYRVLGVTCTTATFLLLGSNDTSIHAQNEVTYNAGPKVDTRPLPVSKPEKFYDERIQLTRDTGVDMEPCWKYEICGADLLIPVPLPDNNGVKRYGYLTGDAFKSAGPYIQGLEPGADKWRSPTMLISSEIPSAGKPITFDGAANVDQYGTAQEVIYNSHRSDGREVTIFPNDAVTLPDGRIVMSYMSVSGEITPDNANWTTNYSGLAISTDGNYFERINPFEGAPVWMNDEHNLDPSQMWSMQLDGDYVYIISVRAGRAMGPMIMLRVPWQNITDKSAYQYWNGDEWGSESRSLFPEKKYGEPSLRKLDDGTPEGLWVMSYMDYTYTQLMTRTAKSPVGPWSEPKIQMSWKDLNALYGGFIHPESTPDNLILMISTWQREIDEEKYGEFGKLIRYDVSHLNTTT